jgi:hypothetical protein
MNKPLTFLLSLTFLFLLLTGFSLGGFVDDLKFKGTSIGVSKCIDRNKQDEVPHSLIKKRCVDENEKRFERNVLAGKSGYSLIYTTQLISINLIGTLYESSESYTKYCVNKEVSSKELISGTNGSSCRKHTWTGKSKFSGTLNNKSNDKIITYLEVHINHADDPDITKLIYDVWILPNESFRFSEEELVFQPEQNKIDSKFYSWSIENVKGVDFILK